MNDTMMNDDGSVLRGQLQEFGVAFFSFLAALGFMNEALVGAGAAALVAVVLVVHAFSIKSSWQKVTTLVRKMIGSLGGVAVAGGWLAAGTVDGLDGLVGVVVPMVWSWLEKVVYPDGVVGLLVLGFLGLFVFSGCKAVDVAVDRSQLKARTATHDVYPSSAVRPVVNEEEAMEFFRGGVDAVNSELGEVSDRIVEAGK